MDGQDRDEVTMPLVRTESRWVDGSEVQGDWFVDDDVSNNDNDRGENVRRPKLLKKAHRVDSFDVEAMEVAGAHNAHNK
ncbi:hypothetical protein KI387_008447, partial [Taxus chinensis]